MQRQNSILRKRKGFAIIAAMAVIVVIATIMSLSLALTTQTAKRTTDIYLYEQSVLLAKSAAELAMERIASGAICNGNATRFTNLNFLHNGIYNINVDATYFLPTTYACAGAPNIPYSAATSAGPYAPLYGSVMLDVTVTVNDATITSEPITYFRRTIQKL